MPNEVNEDIHLKPITPDEGTGNDREKEFLKYTIEHINNLFS
ncbi:hypothetical protein [Methyloglobulus sp.]